MEDIKTEKTGFKNKKEAEKYYEGKGWDIIQPKMTVDRTNCEHDWVKIKTNDYQCNKCRQGYLGNPFKELK